MPLTPGTILNNRYRILTVLGKGGFGAVYRAADMSLKRPCAVKENLNISPEASRQFEKEATILANLSHPNLPMVLDHFLIKDQGQYLVMDFIEGEDLRSLVEQNGLLNQEKAVNIISQIAGALDYLHHQNPPVIHRDIKPSNIRVRPDGKAYLVDFGLVKAYTPNLRTTIGARAVTPGYSPPEQYGVGTTDTRTDIYALAATLYTLLTGFEPQESVQRVVQDQLLPLNTIEKGINANLSKVVTKAMSLQPGQRYDTILSFEKALNNPPTLVVAPTMQVSPSTQKVASSTVSLPSQQKPRSRKRWFWLVVIGGIVGMIIMFSIIIYKSLPSLKPTSQPVAIVQGETTPRESNMDEMPENVVNNLFTHTPLPTFTHLPTLTNIPPTNTKIPSTNTLMPSTSSTIPSNPEFTASENMFCRDGPGPEYEDHTMVLSGEIVPVLARWSNGWYLVGIDNPNTRTKCCWIGGLGNLNVSVTSIQIINYLVDRITCQPK